MHPINGEYDFKHLKDIHYFIFQDVYEWAGKIRTVDIGKGNLFCRVQFIESFAEEVFGDFYSSCYEFRKKKSEFIEAFAKHYADMNALHPFREGNGRAQREFSRELCLACGYVFDLTQTSHEEMLEASVRSFNSGDSSGFISIFDRSIIPIEKYKNYQSRLTTTILILSQDDI